MDMVRFGTVRTMPAGIQTARNNKTDCIDYVRLRGTVLENTGSRGKFITGFGPFGRLAKKSVSDEWCGQVYLPVRTVVLLRPFLTVSPRTVRSRGYGPCTHSRTGCTVPSWLVPSPTRPGAARPVICHPGSPLAFSSWFTPLMSTLSLPLLAISTLRGQISTHKIMLFQRFYSIPLRVGQIHT